MFVLTLWAACEIVCWTASIFTVGGLTPLPGRVSLVTYLDVLVPRSRWWTTMFHSYVILFNISKKHNFGNLIRTAHAFGVTEIVLVGRSHFTTYGSFTRSEERRV